MPAILVRSWRTCPYCRDSLKFWNSPGMPADLSPGEPVVCAQCGGCAVLEAEALRPAFPLEAALVRWELGRRSFRAWIERLQPLSKLLPYIPAAVMAELILSTPTLPWF